MVAALDVGASGPLVLDDNSKGEVMVATASVNGKAGAPAAATRGAFPPRRRETVGIPIRSKMLPPPVRMVLVRASAWQERKGGEWEAGADACPVLALHARLQDTWAKMLPAGQYPADVFPDRKTLEAAGWAFEERVEQFGVLFLDDGRVASSLNPWELDGWATELVPCPWPGEEDEARLRPFLDRVTARALEMARRDEARKAEARHQPIATSPEGKQP
jgi:hypothetical protein